MHRGGDHQAPSLGNPLPRQRNVRNRNVLRLPLTDIDQVHRNVFESLDLAPQQLGAADPPGGFGEVGEDVDPTDKAIAPGTGRDRTLLVQLLLAIIILREQRRAQAVVERDADRLQFQGIDPRLSRPSVV